MALDTKDKKYIDTTINRAIDRSHKQFQKETNHYLDTLLEHQTHEMKALRELMEVRPTREEIREEVREVVRQEVWPIRQEVSLFREDMETFRVEMVNMRKDVNIHEKRIGKLEETCC